MIGLVLRKAIAQKGHINVPGLGSFVASEVPAVLHFADRTVAPPQLHITFVAEESYQVTQLTDILATDFGMDQAQVQAVVAPWVKQAIQSLEIAHRFDITGLGMLKTDVEGTIHFHPKTEENYEVESYGLPVLKAEMLATKRKRKYERETPVIPLHPYDSKEKTNRKREFRWATVAAVFTALLVSFATVFYLSKEAVQDSQTLAKNNRELHPQKAELVPSLPENPKAPANLSPSKNDSNPPKVLQESEPVKSLSKPRAGSSFYVIAGSFRMEDKSREQKEKLSKSGYSCTIIYSEEKALNRISIGKFDSRAAALTFLTETQPRFEDQLWVLTE